MVLARLSDRTPFFVGLSLGISIALIVLPILEDRCSPPGPRRVAQRSPLSDDYEPIINLQGSPELNKVREIKLQHIRPRYYSSELGIREKLLIAVVTSSSTFHSRALFFNKTLLGEVKSTRYFVELEKTGEKIDLTSFPNVDVIPAVPEDKHPSLLAFEVVSRKYMVDYDFVFIVSDSTYVHVERLLQLVSRFSANENLHMGMTDRGSLSFSQCFLTGGVLLSHSLVRQAASRLQECHSFQNDHIKESFLSNCIYFLTQVPCSSEFQGKQYVSWELQYPSELPNWVDVKRSITIQPVREGPDLLRLHQLVCQQHLKEIYLEINNTNLTEPWPLGIEPSFKPLARFHVLTWTYFNETHVLPVEDRLPLFAYSNKPKYADLENAIQSCKQWYNAKSEVPVALKFINGYTRMDPARGVEYVLDFRTNITDLFERFIVFRPLSQSEMLPVPYVTEHTRIIMLVPVTAKGVPTAISFLELYESTCLKKQENTALVLILLYNATDPGKDSENDVFKDLKSVSLNYANKYRSTGAKLVWYSIRTLKSGVTLFPILDLVVRKLPPTSLVLLSHINVVIDVEYLNRVRMNTIAKHQVFFPIPFIQYNPSLTGEDPVGEFDVKKQSGIFDNQAFEHCSFYISDYISSRSLVEKGVPVASAERDLNKIVYYDVSVDLIDMFLRAASLHVLRAVEPLLKVPYRPPICSVDFSPQCRAAFKRSLGAKSHLAKFLLMKKLKEYKQGSS